MSIAWLKVWRDLWHNKFRTGIVLALSAVASLWPALRATRVSVREALAYE
jgi:ABC-type lipoprotein release transport system permease subunit